MLSNRRVYRPDHHYLKLCKSLDEKARERDRYCRNGTSCKYAHSQEELEAWRSAWGPIGKKKCRNGEHCKFKDTCRYAHTDEELSSRTEGRHNNLKVMVMIWGR